MSKQRPRILVTNDDGILAPGIRALVEVAKEFGEVFVVAPDKPQSAQGHAITIREPLRLKKVNVFENVQSYECSGTPVDCVKIAKQIVLEGKAPDLCLSGINHGSNASINIMYSGTMAAAMEGSLQGSDSIGFSLLDFDHDANFEPSKRFVRTIIRYVLENGLTKTQLLNVNIPKLPENEIKGIKICRQAEAQWVETFKENLDPIGKPYYWLTGVFVNHDQGHDSDVLALSEGYVSVVPCQHDLTAYQAIQPLKNLEEL